MADASGSDDRAGVPPDWTVFGPAIQQLVDVVASLRAPGGCPWDRQQTLETIKPYTLEETYELLEAIDSGDDGAIVEELGDVLLQVLLDAQIGADEGRFSLQQVVEGLTAKLIRRHPHVFGSVAAETPAQVAANWDRIKQTEKARESVLDGLPKDLPALARAARLTTKAARIGFDFPHRDMLFDKLREELRELAAELYPDGALPELAAQATGTAVPDEPLLDEAQRARAEAELGDVLFVMANVARRWGLNPEEALRKSNAKFERRLRAMESLAAEGFLGDAVDLRGLTLEQQEVLYQEVKRREGSASPS